MKKSNRGGDIIVDMFPNPCMRLLLRKRLALQHFRKRLTQMWVLSIESTSSSGSLGLRVHGIPKRRNPFMLVSS